MEKNISFDGLILQNNKQAMDYLHQGNLESALKLLLHSLNYLKENHVPKSNSLWGITFNNLGCVYRKADNKKGALHYLSKALDMEIQNSYDATNVASTHLNISAILSSLGDHETSLAHALASLKTLQNSASRNTNSSISIIIAYHSIGIENEFLRKFNDAIIAYRKGWEIAAKELGEDHRLTDTLKKAYHKGCNTPTMPILKNIKKRIKKSFRPNESSTLLPLVSTKGSRGSSLSKKSSAYSHKYTPVNRSSQEPNLRYAIKTRSSLSPIGDTKYKFLSEINSINKLIKELDGGITKKKIRLVKNNYTKFQKQAIIIQKFWRGYLARKKYIEIVRKNKIKSMNNMHRKVLVLEKRKSLQENKILRPIPEIKVETKFDAIVLIQAYYRMYRLRKKYRRIRAAAIKIQRFFRMKATRKLFLLVCDAVVFIQSVYRGYSVRKIVKF